jgi:type II secretory pathway component PulF
MEELGDVFGDLTNKLSGWLESIILLLPNIVLALAVMGIGYVLTKYVRGWISRIVNRFPVIARLTVW